MKKLRAFTLIELLVVIAIIALLIGILVPALGAAKKQANRIKNGTQVRGIAEALALWSDANASATSDFPGVAPVNSSLPTNAQDSHVINRFWALVAAAAGDSLSGKLLIDPVGQDKVYTGTQTSSNAPIDSGGFTSASVSYAFIDAGSTEWKNNTNANAYLVGDKNLGGAVKGGSSYWSAATWQGHLGWGDVHVSYESSDTTETVTIQNNTTQMTGGIFAGSATSVNLPLKNPGS